ncbi:peptide/nickel transport system substrate-binding protein [Asanoa ferruginea]|uniref:Peptide/nickel transport system substrate-binding protein n=1 Tax=Asanoa ferruginea TaxID=53367 RepID=A0A3D9ZND3_9ACTN|nr:peptide ABC transporter substrate-binding protein [Asanoa ferruginea]REF98878.1 peptide/nickel transport system substrate-binding protein [Asanoa ferruginea]GIF46440.1 diguanylate phosphodiesterase [Asanoa ferruginea]
MAPPNRVVVGLAEEPDVLVQDFTGRHSTWAVLAPLTLKLVRYDDHWRPWPEMAERLPAPADGSWVRHPDGRTTMRYRLRTGLRWHDGRPVTADDVVASYRLLRSLECDYPHREIVEAIDDMTAAGLSLTVRWGATNPYAVFEEWGSVLPARLLDPLRLADPAAWPELPQLRLPISHGPFRAAEWVPGERIRLVRCQPHPRGAAAVDEIVFRFLPGSGELRDAVAAGEVDVTDLSGFTAADARALRAGGSGVRVAVVPSSMWEHIDFNLDDRHLRDVRVRHAVAHAVDRQAISDTLHDGLAEVAHSWLPARHPAHNDTVRRYPHDPRAARSLLSAAGYTPGPDGILRDASGDRLCFRLLTTTPSVAGGRWSASSTRTRAGELLADQLRAVGVELRVDAVPAGDAFRRFRSRDFPHLAMFAWSIALEANGHLMWHSGQVPRRAGDYGLNLAGWRSPTNDRLLDRIIAEGDPTARTALIAEQQAEWAEQLPSLPLFFLPQIDAVRRGLTGVRHVGAFGTYVTWNSWQWAWEETAR